MELMVASMVVVVMVMSAMGRGLRRRRKVELWARVGHHERRMGDLIWKYSVNFLRNNKKKVIDTCGCHTLLEKCRIVGHHERRMGIFICF